MTLQLGSSGDLVSRWRHVMAAMFAGYARRIDPDTGTTIGPLDPGAVFGDRAAAWQREYERNTHQPVDGIVSDADLAALKLVLPHRPIWCYSAPGSGVPWNVGPPFDLGEKCKLILNLNHQPVGYPIGGYMGAMGGDPKYSYNDIIAMLAAELERLLGLNPDVQRAMAARAHDAGDGGQIADGQLTPVDVELWFLSYSQSADGMKRAVQHIFGPGGPYALIRDRINGIVAFGDPSKPKTGIARLVYAPADWVTALTHDITNESPTPDFYAEAHDDIRPLFYEWIVRANTSLPFVVYSAKIVIPALLGLVAPFLAAMPGLSGLASPLAVPMLAGVTGLAPALMSTLIGGVMGSDEEPDPKLIEFLSVKGILTNAPALIGLLMAMPGVAVHGDYYAPKPEFGSRAGIDVGYDIVASFRR